MLTSRRQRVAVEVDPDARTMHVDPTKLQEVLRNLVANASTYAPEDTAIGINVRRSGETFAIDVTDQGPGIPTQDLPRIFERFYRVDKARARDPGGSGLGLAIVKHLVELHGGSVTVSNRPEGGARFTIELKIPAPAL
jgi:two-component system phosphate regulon sensor histidine kinase PhoR